MTLQRLPALSKALTTMSSPFSSAHRLHVKSLYKRYLVDAQNWCISRDLWRNRAIEIRAEFERNRSVLSHTLN